MKKGMVKENSKVILGNNVIKSSVYLEIIEVQEENISDWSLRVRSSFNMKKSKESKVRQCLERYS